MLVVIVMVVAVGGGSPSTVPPHRDYSGFAGLRVRAGDVDQNGV